MSEPGTSTWRGIHLFFPGHVYGPWCDRVLLEVVDPFIARVRSARLVDRWFFIRYGEFGPHIRLRLHGETTALEMNVIPDLIATMRARDPGIIGEISANDAEWMAPTADEIAALRLRRFAQIEYEPEYARYGGPVGIRLAERHFQDSSELAIAMLQRGAGATRESRLGRALLATLVLVATFFPDEGAAAKFFSDYVSGFLMTIASDADRRSRWMMDFETGYDRQAEQLAPFVVDAWRRLRENESLSSELDAFHESLQALHSEFRHDSNAGQFTFADGRSLGAPEAIPRIVPSYVHMTNNRIGATVAEEAYITHVIRRALFLPGRSAVTGNDGAC